MKQTVARVGAVGPGVMRPLLFDRGLGDGATVGRLNALGVDSLFVLKAGMDLWTDAEALAGATRQRLLDARGLDQKVSPPHP